MDDLDPPTLNRRKYLPRLNHPYIDFHSLISVAVDSKKRWPVYARGRRPWSSGRWPIQSLRKRAGGRADMQQRRLQPSSPNVTMETTLYHVSKNIPTQEEETRVIWITVREVFLYLHTTVDNAGLLI